MGDLRPEPPVRPADPSPPTTGAAVAARPTRRLEVVVATTALGAAATFLLLTTRITSRVQADGLSPQWWPTVLGGCAVLLSLALLVGAVRREPAERAELDEATPGGRLRVVATAGACVAFLLAWDLVGFVVPAPLFLLALLLLYGARNRVALVLLPVGVTAGIYLLFDLLLKVPL